MVMMTTMTVKGTHEDTISVNRSCYDADLSCTVSCLRALQGPIDYGSCQPRGGGGPYRAINHSSAS
jgi:hypothetical protein